MVLGNFPVPGRSTIWRVGVVWTFLLSSILFPLSPSLWETARYALKYCLKGPLNPTQPTILSFFLPLFQEGQLSVTGKYVHEVLVNR